MQFLWEVTIRQDRLSGQSREHELRAIIIFWLHEDQQQNRHCTSITFHINYYDSDSRFSHLVFPGYQHDTEDRLGTDWDGGLFVRSTYYLAEKCGFEADQRPPALLFTREEKQRWTSVSRLSDSIGIGFNRGNMFGNVAHGEPARGHHLRMAKSLEDYSDNIEGSCKHLFHAPANMWQVTDLRDLDAAAGRTDARERRKGDKFCESKPSFAGSSTIKALPKQWTLPWRGMKKLCISTEIMDDHQPRGEFGRPLNSAEDVCIHFIGFPGALTPQ